MERILQIDFVENEIIERKKDGRTSKCEGFAVTTSDQVIYLLMESEDQCCESFGYFLSEEDFNIFIGADLLNVYLTDTALYRRQIDDIQYGSNQSLSTMFVNLETSKGTLQFVAYNAHNGYYGHDAFVFTKKLYHEEVL